MRPRPRALASIGDVTPTPWDTEREYSEEELGKQIAAMPDQVPRDAKTILNFHCPPYARGSTRPPSSTTS